MSDLVTYLPILSPIILVQVVLALTALVHVLKHPDYRFGNKAVWILVVLFIQIIGPVVYFIFGKGEE